MTCHTYAPKVWRITRNAITGHGSEHLCMWWILFYQLPQGLTSSSPPRIGGQCLAPQPPTIVNGLFMLQDFSQPDRLERETLRSNFKLHFYHTPWECLKMCLTTICFLQIYLQLLVPSQSTLRLLGWSYSLVNLALGKGFWSNLLNVWTGVLWKYLDWHPHEEYGGI